MEDRLQENLAILKNIPFFTPYTDDILEKIAEKMMQVPFQKGELILQAGSEARRLYVIKKGKVRVFKDDQEIAVLDEGKFFGEIGLITSEKRTASVEAVEDTETIVLNKDDFDMLVKEGLFRDEAAREELFRRIRENFEKGL